MTDTDRLDWLERQHAEVWSYPVIGPDEKPTGDHRYAARLGAIVRCGETVRQALDGLAGAVAEHTRVMEAPR
jgi:hypothetical protein